MIDLRNISFFVLLSMISLTCSKKERTLPEVTSISESIYASGVIKAKDQYEVVSEVNGIIKEIHVSEGDHVDAQEILFTIDKTVAELETENARLALKMAEKAKMDLQNLEREMRIAKEKFEQDSLMLVRQENLWENQFGSKYELEQKQLNMKRSRSEFKNLKDQVDQRRDQIEIELGQARNRWRISQQKQANHIIKSNIGGRVYQVMQVKGEPVTAYKTIALIGAPDEFIVEVQVDEVDINRVKLDQEIFLTINSNSDTVYTAQVSKITPIMKAGTGTFTVEGTFLKQPEQLFPNQTLESNILIQTKNCALVIPRDYLVDDRYVLIDEDERVQVKTGIMTFDKVEILEGISSSQYIYKPE